MKDYHLTRDFSKNITFLKRTREKRWLHAGDYFERKQRTPRENEHIIM